jgi:two-component system response regulator RegX3
MSVLIVDNNDEAVEQLDQVLTSHGYDIERATTGVAALRQLAGTSLVLLELSLPDLAGYEVCRRIREHSCVPVIAMSDRGDELDRVIALRMGADDIVHKPCGQHELLARIQAVLRRSGACAVRCAAPPLGLEWAPAPQPAPEAVAAGVLRVGELSLDPAAYLVRLREAEVSVTRREFELLTALMEHPGVVMERGVIMSRVWGKDWFGSTRTLDVHVGSLRRKLGGSGWIRTVRGVGYKLTDPVNRAA